MRGAKVLSLVVEMFNIRFIDSLNFFPMKLANLPKTFGIEELKNGHFPHLFNKKENENYVGPIPPVPYYNSNDMNPKDKGAFMIWHASKRESNYVFNFHEEIIAYCRSDVDILRRCCLEFRELVLQRHRHRSVHDAHHRLGLPSRVSYQLPSQRYDRYHSAHGIYPQEETVLVCAQMVIVYGREARNSYSTTHATAARNAVGDNYLDGYHEKTHTAYEVQGCFWHGLSEMLRPRYHQRVQS